MSVLECVPEGFLDELVRVAGERHVLQDDERRASYECDWTGRFKGRSVAVVRPATVDEVVAILKVCTRYQVPIVPQGGNTGLVGGSVPRAGEVVVSLSRLRELGPIDAATGQVTVGAGVTLSQLQAHAMAEGLDAALDFGARDSATIGGIVACDAGGARALRYGTAGARVCGVEAVLADGTLIRRLSGLAKDNAGYDVRGLLVGSEGTLSVITAVRWRLVPRLAVRVAALVPVPNERAVLRLLTALRANCPSLDACELITEEALSLVVAHRSVSQPVTAAPLYVLVELAARTDPTDELANAFDAADVSDAAVADDAASRRRLWGLREGITDAIAAVGVPHKLDVGLPVQHVVQFIDVVSERVSALRAASRVVIFGHLGDGNLHVNVLGVSQDDTDVDDAVLEAVIELGGTISAEHGVGVAKRSWLTRALSEGEIATMRAIKHSLDPRGLLNPGVILAEAI